MEKIFYCVQIGILLIVDYWVYINIILAIIMVFFQRNEPEGMWAWLLLLWFIPIVGFFLYLILHQDFKKKHMFYVKEIEDKLNRNIQQQYGEEKSYQINDLDMQNYNAVVRYNQEVGAAVYTEDNTVEILTDGKELLERLLKEIDQAEHFIHLEYYIIQNDQVFDEIEKHLIAKVKEGVKVRILYDALGCRSFPKKRWKRLAGEGISIKAFFPAKFGIFHIRVNYHNHRKIVVIDNRIGFTGGYNIGREYLSLDKKFGYWRDTHLAFYGSSVIALGLRFALDWNYAAKENLFLEAEYFSEYTDNRREEVEKQRIRQERQVGVQIITSGPDSREAQIRNTYIALIHKARKKIYIQTPYFIPDQVVMTALEVAIHSGVEVKLMIPCKPDHPFVYWATYSYMGDLLEKGARCYIYTSGFLHAKGIIVDGETACYGSANMDIRSFRLNFEVNAVLYNAKIASYLEHIFEQDILCCDEITWQQYEARKLTIRFREQLSRLLSPVL